MGAMPDQADKRISPEEGSTSRTGSGSLAITWRPRRPSTLITSGARRFSDSPSGCRLTMTTTRWSDAADQKSRRYEALHPKGISLEF